MFKRLQPLPLTFLTVFLCCSKPATAESDYRFHSPTRNIYCSLTVEYVSCDVLNHTWNTWGCLDSGCFGNRFTLPANGSAYARRSSDSMKGFTTNTLGYGLRITLGPISCDSLHSGITCTNKQGGRMHLNSKSYELK